jgi:hypothetical protein
MPTSDNGRIEYLTIIAATAAEAMTQFRDRGLSGLGYSITGQIGSHRIVTADGRADLSTGDGFVAATFQRLVPTPRGA